MLGNSKGTKHVQHSVTREFTNVFEKSTDLLGQKMTTFEPKTGCVKQNFLWQNLGR